MIVNVNPYDTGFDENVHVMKFAALAREVCTVPATNAARAPPSPTKPKTNGVRASVNGPHRRTVTLSFGGAGRKASEAHLEVLEGKFTCSTQERIAIDCNIQRTKSWMTARKPALRTMNPSILL